LRQRIQNQGCGKYPIPNAAEAGGLQFSCNNKGLLKKLSVFCQYKNTCHATCLHSKWDHIISSIHEIQSRFAWLPRLTHFKGHQDYYSNEEDRDLATPMNIKADKLATTALKGGKSRPVVPFGPSTGFMLTLGTIQIKSTFQQYKRTYSLQK
jgi:hypothetical protein